MAEFELDMIPQESVVFSGEADGAAEAEIRMGNELPKQVAYRVSTSHPALFSIADAVGLIDPDDGVQVRISLLKGQPLNGVSFTVAYIVNKEKMKSGEEAWAKAAGPGTTATLDATFELLEQPDDPSEDFE